MTNEAMQKYLKITRTIAISFGVVNLIIMGVIYNVSPADWTAFLANTFRVVAAVSWGIFILSIMASATLQYKLKERTNKEKIAKMQAELEALKKTVGRGR